MKEIINYRIIGLVLLDTKIIKQCTKTLNIMA